MASNALEEKINKIKLQNEEIRRRHEVRFLKFMNIRVLIVIYLLNIYMFILCIAIGS
jgi:hypothetical protein